MTILDSKEALKFRGFETKFEHKKKKKNKKQKNKGECWVFEGIAVKIFVKPLFLFWL